MQRDRMLITARVLSLAAAAPALWSAIASVISAIGQTTVGDGLTRATAPIFITISGLFLSVVIAVIALALITRRPGTPSATFLLASVALLALISLGSIYLSASPLLDYPVDPAPYVWTSIGGLFVLTCSISALVLLARSHRSN